MGEGAPRQREREGGGVKGYSDSEDMTEGEIQEGEWRNGRGMVGRGASPRCWWAASSRWMRVVGNRRRYHEEGRGAASQPRAVEEAKGGSTLPQTGSSCCGGDCCRARSDAPLVCQEPLTQPHGSSNRLPFYAAMQGGHCEEERPEECPEGLLWRRSARRRKCGGGWMSASNMITVFLLLVLSLVGQASGGTMAGGPCTTILTDLANVFGELKPCGAEVTSTAPGAGMVGTLTIKFATSVALEATSQIRLTFPTQRDGYAFNFPPGTDSELEALVVQYGSQRTQMAHGTGTPELGISGNVATITLGGFGSPTIQDSEGGYIFTITNVRNPYVNNGLPAGQIGLELLTGAGGFLDAVNLTAPVFEVGNLRVHNASINLEPNSAGVPATVQLNFNTDGYIPYGGRLLLTLPDGFVVR